MGPGTAAPLSEMKVTVPALVTANAISRYSSTPTASPPTGPSASVAFGTV